MGLRGGTPWGLFFFQSAPFLILRIKCIPVAVSPRHGFSYFFSPTCFPLIFLSPKNPCRAFADPSGRHRHHAPKRRGVPQTFLSHCISSCFFCVFFGSTFSLHFLGSQSQLCGHDGSHFFWFELSFYRLLAISPLFSYFSCPYNSPFVQRHNRRFSLSADPG